jgi:glycosyltransferase involved in cell wall biosynthesis
LKIIFLVQGMNVAASRYRVLQYLPFFHANGIDTEVFEFPQQVSGWSSMLERLKTGDIIFTQRKRLPRSILLLLKRLKKRMVYDFDDAVMFKNSLSKKPYSLRRTMSFKRMLRYTDLVIAGNAFLKDEAEKYHKNVKVLPTPVDAERYREKEFRESDTVNIGWIGDHGSIHYMERYKDVWDAIGQKYNNVVLTIICDTFIEAKGISIKKIPWSYEREIDDLMALDIGVMPLFDDLWSRGKCGFKIIQYLGVGVPAVCTPVGINRDVVEDGVNGLWAVTKDEWIERLSMLIENSSLRVKMGKEGRKKIMDQYTVQVCAPKLMEWITKAT